MTAGGRQAHSLGLRDDEQEPLALTVKIQGLDLYSLSQRENRPIKLRLSRLSPQKMGVVNPVKEVVDECDEYVSMT